MNSLEIRKALQQTNPDYTRVLDARQKGSILAAFLDSWPPFFRSKVFLLALIALLGFVLTGCGIVPDGQVAAANPDTTPIPTPTRDPSGYQAVPSEACLASDWTTLQTNRVQGSLLAWQPQQENAAPGTSNLAYLGPTERSAWYTGELSIAIGPDYSKRIPLAPGVLATGDLTWSPSGHLLAFVGYRQNEGLYTAIVVAADGSSLTDLFPADIARTDNRAGQKAIIGWKDDQTVQVMASCGEECRQAYDFKIGTAPGPVLTPTVVDNYRELNQNLSMYRNQQEYKADQYPKVMRTPHWSPDNQLIAYLDKRGLLWMLSTKTKTMYPLDIGLRDVYETQWSYDNSSIAVRAEDRIFVFEIPCRP